MNGADNLFFEDFSPDMPAIVTDSVTITQENISLFAQLTGDTNPLHLDVEAAADGPFRAIVAHGMLILSITSGLAYKSGLVQRANAVFLRLDWQFCRPVRPGEEVRAELRVIQTQKDERNNGGEVSLNVKVVKKPNKLVATGVWTIWVKARLGKGVQAKPEEAPASTR